MGLQKPSIDDDVSFKTLASRAVHGDTDSIRALILRYAPTMRALARRFVATDEEIDAVVENAIIIVFNTIDPEEDPCAFRTRLLQATCRECLARLSYVKVQESRSALS